MMNKKLNKVLLIDDDDDINFINKLVIEDIKDNIHIESMQSVEDAIAYLVSGENPDLIFLDINMPVATGWDFIDEYKKISIDKEHRVIVMLTSSLNIEDKKKALAIREINEYMSKPLTAEMVQNIFTKYF